MKCRPLGHFCSRGFLKLIPPSLHFQVSNVLPRNNTFHSPLSSSFLSRSCLLTVGCCFLLLLLLSLFLVHVIWGLGVVMHTSDFGRLYKSSWCVLLLGFANGCLVDIFEALMFVIGFCALFI